MAALANHAGRGAELPMSFARAVNVNCEEMQATYWPTLGHRPVRLGYLAGGDLSFARVLSDHGLIVGLATPADGEGHAFVVRAP